MSRPRLAMRVAGFVVAFVSISALKASGYQDAPIIVPTAALVAGGVVATVVAKGW